MNVLMTRASLNDANTAISEVMLSGKYAGRALYLTFDVQEAQEIAQRLGVDEHSVEELCARLVGEALDRGRNPFLTASRAARLWASEGMVGPPPFLALLHVMSHAAELMANDGEYAANAYYPRLASLVGVSSGNLRDQGKQTELFWRLLETWLAENDYELGRPTASARGTWKYVGLSMSQAIVRSTDRAAMHDLFDTYGFSNGDRLTAADIFPYVDDWIRSSGSTARLRKAWEQKELRERVCEIAIDEFQDWSNDIVGSPIVQGKEQSSRLTLVAQVLPSFPRQRLSLHLGRSTELGEPVTGIVDKLGNSFSIANSTFGAFATVSPNPMGRDNSGLAASVSISGSGHHLRWSSGLVIPLTKSSEGPYWTEIARVSIGTENIVLVRNKKTLVEALENLLAATSTGEAIYLTSQELDGIPDGWILYKDVRIIRAADWEVETDLERLVPMSEGAGFVISGGLQLARGIWHSKAPPAVDLVTDNGPTRLEAQRPSFGGLQLARESQSDSRTCNLPMQDLGDASYTVRGYTGTSQVAETLVVLRSAERARPRDRQMVGRLAYGEVFSATELSAEGFPCMIRGYIVSPKPPAVEQALSVEAPSVAKVPTSEGALDDEESDFVQEELLAAISQSCAGRGYHVWKCESPPRRVSMSTPLKMECKDCNLAVIARNRGRKKKKPEQASAPIALRSARGKWERPQRSVDLDFDLLFDALCFLGSGSWGRMDRLLVGQDIPSWTLGEMAGTWASLSLIDVSYAPGTHRPKKWSVPPPAVCATGDGEGYFAGFRCDSLIELALEELVGLGGTPSVIEQDGAPRYIGFRSVDLGALTERISSLEDPLGRSFSIVEQPALDMVRATTSIPGLEASLISISTGASPRNLQCFDVEGARWRRADAIPSEGAYRFDHAGRVYVYRAADGREFMGPQQVIKLLAARQRGSRLHRYDEQSREFTSTRGAEPVGLLARALVACSGRLPRKDDSGLTIYENVRPEVGQAVLFNLYSRKLIE